MALLLGQTVAVPQGYAPELLTPIPRAAGRGHLPNPLPPWVGVDRWVGYEVSWLDGQGQPRAAVAELYVPADSPALIESKSLKLYFNGLNMTRWPSVAALRATITEDLSRVAGASVAVTLTGLQEWQPAVSPTFGDAAALLLDALSGNDFRYDYDPMLLAIADGPAVVQRYVMATFRSLCPVTGQPDWGSLYLRMVGPPLEPVALLRYLVSFRNHSGFHETCIETIYSDLWRLGMGELVVCGRFLRRGGWEINPVRAAHADLLPQVWFADPRQ